MQGMWIRALGQEGPLEEEMAARSSILAWRIQWTEEPSGLHSPWSGQESDMNERTPRKFTRKWLTLPPQPTQRARDLTISKKRRHTNDQKL